MHPTDAVAGLSSLPSAEQLPDDLPLLKTMIVELVTSLHRERRDNDALRQRIDRLLRRLYGPRGERFDPNQLLLFADLALAQDPPPTPRDTEATPAEKNPKKRRCRPHGRRRMPDHLPRESQHHELSLAARLCPGCGQMRVDIGVDKSEQLDFRPASLIVIEHLVHKYVCRGCCPPPGTAAEQSVQQEQDGEPAPGRESPSPPVPPQERVPEPMEPQPSPAASPRAEASPSPPPAGVVVAAAKPAMPIAKGLPGPGLLAHLIVSKYVDHLPLHRLQRIYERQGLVLPRSTTCDWLAASGQLLRPLYHLLVSVVLQSRVIHTDDTPVKMQVGAPSRRLDTARLWTYLGDAAHPYNVFDFTPNRKRDGPQTFLANFQGYLQADAFSGYDGLYLPSPRDGVARIIEVACNAHARRKFHEARSSDALRSHQALAYYGQLYELERSARANDFDHDQKRRLRQDLSVLILEKFHQWLERERAEVLPKSPMGEAIAYTLHNWQALVRYTEAGFLAIDNNVAEREMKRIAIGRKNWLFVGSEQGGRTAAVLFSFTSTCQRLGVEPWAYLQDVLSRLPVTPAAELAELLPDRWQAARRATATAAANSPAKPSAKSQS